MSKPQLSHEIQNQLRLEQLQSVLSGKKRDLQEARERNDIRKLKALQGECIDLLTQIHLLDPTLPKDVKEWELQSLAEDLANKEFGKKPN